MTVPFRSTLIKDRAYWLRVQRALEERGFEPGPIDGLRGPRTDAAIVAFKKTIGLRARPFVGPLTEAALFAERIERSEAGSLPWMQEATLIRDIHEARDTARLQRWFDASVAWIDPREIPWCGAFVLTCLKRSPLVDSTPKNPLSAQAWKYYAKETNPRFGALLVFWRGSPSSWKGHVGFYVGEDDTHYHVLGGNQRNAVNVTRIEQKRLITARWPTWSATTGPIRLTANGVPVTVNEA